MPRMLTYICWYYVVVFIVSLVQLILIIKVGYPFVLDIFPVYYMAARITVMVIFLVAWILQLRMTLLWCIVFDSVILIFGNLYLCLVMIWSLLELFSWETFLIHIKYSGFYYGWNIILTLPGVVVLVYVLKNFLEIAKPYKIAAPDAQREKKEEQKATLHTLGRIEPKSFWRISTEESDSDKLT